MVQDRKKVVWFEGMTLDPHHFQQWDHHRDDVLDARLEAAAPEAWGLSALDVDEDRLANGELVLRRCTAVLADGLVVDVPDASPLPESRNLEEQFPSTEDRVRVLLAVPTQRRKGRNVKLRATDQQRETRYIAETKEVPDENTGSDERPVRVARTNVQVRLGSETQQGYSTLPLAEVVRTAGGFELNDQFVPPCLHLCASDRLLRLTRQVLERLVSKNADLEERQQDAFAQRELTPSDVQALNLRGTINAYVPQLNQLETNGQSHPRDLFRTLIALAGRLSTYVKGAPVRPRDLPTYDHGAPSEGFLEIDRILRQMLGEATPSANYERVDLDQRRENLFVASVRDELLEEAQLLLVVRSEQHPEDELTDDLPDMLRIASPDTIDSVLQSYTRALNVKVTRRLPAGMPVDSQAIYFRLQRRGSFWESIQEEGGIAIFRPSDFQEAEFELMAAL